MRKLFLKLFLIASLAGCASMPTSEAYWEKKWQEMSEEDRQGYRDYAYSTGLPIAICDLNECIFVWIY